MLSQPVKLMKQIPSPFERGEVLDIKNDLILLKGSPINERTDLLSLF